MSEELNIKVDRSLNLLQELGKAHNVNSDLLHNEIKIAKNLFKENLDTLIDGSDGFRDTFIIYSNEVNKPYSDWENNKIQLLEDSAIPLSSNSKYNRWIDNNLTPTDLRQDISTAYNDEFATSLAIADFSFKNQLTSSVLLSGGFLKSIKGSSLLNDAHEIGVFPTTYFFSKYFQGIGFGINKFIDRFTSNTSNTDENYLIHIASEFSRSAKYTGEGSDHGTDSSVHTLISNRIKSLKVIGQIQPIEDEPSKNVYHGSWGKAAPGEAISVKKST